MQNFPEKKRKKIDRLALMSAFMRIPRMDIRAARLLLDLGFRETYELCGRSPEILLEDGIRKKLTQERELLPFLRMAVYFSENDPPDAARLHPHAWTD